MTFPLMEIECEYFLTVSYVVTELRGENKQFTIKSSHEDSLL